MNRAFAPGHYDLGPAALCPLSASAAEVLGPALAAMPPWSVLGWSAEGMIRSLKREVPSVVLFEIVIEDHPAGIVAIQDPFLLGPYLQRLAILPEYQGRSVGLRVLEWMEAQARTAKARQLWLCVSSFNTRAQAFYARFGFETAAILDKLASETSDEILMRKRLFYADPLQV
jgi:ribosomal protein S18 acetylase RimI-like enzyme